MNNQLRGRSFFRAALLVPMMLPTVVAGVVWRLMLNPNFGAVNGTLKGLGLNTTALTWTSSPRLAMLSVVAVDVWQWTPFMFLILLAGLQAIPQEPYEAALIDGSSAWQTFRHVTLPLLKPAILVALLLRTMDLLRVFDQVFILTEGGPGFATETISLYIYRTAFRFSDFGYAAAMSFVLLIITNIVSVFYIRVLQARGGSRRLSEAAQDCERSLAMLRGQSGALTVECRSLAAGVDRPASLAVSLQSNAVIGIGNRQ